MNIIKLFLDDPSIWTKEIADKEILTVNSESFIQIAVSIKSIENGQPTISLRFDLDDNKVLLVKTSMEMFLQAAATLLVNYQQDLPAEEEQH